MTAQEHLRFQIFALLIDMRNKKWHDARLRLLAHMQRELIIIEGVNV